MSNGVRIHTLTIDCDDAAVVARFWCALLGYEVESNDTDSIATHDPSGVGPRMLFTWAGKDGTAKNSLHLDLRPDDQAATVARAIDLGARHVDIGQAGDEGWVVLQDPESNEFCVLMSHEDLRRWRQQSGSIPRSSDLG